MIATPNTDALAASIAECRMAGALTEAQAFSQIANHARELEREVARRLVHEEDFDGDGECRICGRGAEEHEELYGCPSETPSQDSPTTPGKDTSR